MRSVELAVDITSTAAEAGFDNTGRAAKEMARDVASASRDASTRLDAIGDSADNLDDKAGRATGALGALSSGFELVGLEEYATGLQSAALATDFASGAGQALTLVLELESVKRARAAVTTVAHTVATKAASAASKAAAAAQWALNAAMSANPIGLVVVALAAAAVGFKIAWDRSERFRAVVQGAMKLIKAAIDPVLDVLKRVAEWVGDRLGPAFDTLKEGATKALGFILDPLDTIKAAIRWILDKLDNLKLPDVPGWINPKNWGGDAAGDLPAAPRFAAPPPPAPGGGTVPPVNIYVNVDGSGIVDPHKVGQALEEVLTRYAARLGRPVVTFP